MSPEAQAGVLPAAAGRLGQHRAGLWHRLCVGLAGPPRRAAGRPGQLRGASWRPPAALQDRFGLRFPLVHASAEQAPFADASFDLVISEYGASIWCDPYAWIPEAARLLRPGGQLIFLVNSVLLMLTVPDQDGLPVTETLLRPYFGMHRFEWPDDDSVEFHLGYGDMIRLLRRCGLQVEELLELRPLPAPPPRTRSSPSNGRGNGLAKKCGRRANCPDSIPLAHSRRQATAAKNGKQSSGDSSRYQCCKGAESHGVRARKPQPTTTRRRRQSLLVTRLRCPHPDAITRAWHLGGQAREGCYLGAQDTGHRLLEGAARGARCARGRG